MFNMIAPRYFLLFTVLLMASFLQAATLGDQAGTPRTDSSFVFTIRDSSSCWELKEIKKDSSPVFRIVNEMPCHLVLKMGSDTIHVKQAITPIKFRMNQKRDTIELIVSDTVYKRLPAPTNTNISMSIRLLNASDSTKCKLKNVVITPCTATKDSDISTNDEGPTYYFIPSPEIEQSFKKQTAAYEVTESEKCCPGTQELIFDYINQCLVPTCDLEECMCKTCRKEYKNACDSCKTKFRCSHRQNTLRRFRPQVDEAVRIRVKGMNPYRDNVVLHVDCYDRNKEGRADFLASLDRMNGTPKKTTPDSTKQKDKTKAQYTEENVRYLILAFREEMMRFYQEKYVLQELNTGFLSQCIAYIQGKIIERFKISSAEPALITEELNRWLDDTTFTKVEKDLYRETLKQGLEYYKKILNYRTSNAWLFQVKNSDITKIEFEWYQNGQRVSANPQTFEFFNKGGFTINYSAGLAINNMVNHGYAVLDSADKKEIARKDDSRINIGPIVLAHAYYRYPILNRFKIGATTGFMTNTLKDDLSLNFLFGGSLLFGSEERFNITFGGVLGKVERLKTESFELNKAIYDTLDSEALTRQVYRCKWIVGLTYNLGG
jgi:hypothetical protein